MPELPVNIIIVLIGNLRQKKGETLVWKKYIYGLYEGLIYNQLSQSDNPNEELIKTIISAIKYDKDFDPVTPKSLKFCEELINSESKFKTSNPPNFPNYWDNIMPHIFDFYIDCLVNINYKVTDTKIRISEKDKAKFLAFLGKDVNQSFRYIIAERIYDIDSLASIDKVEDAKEVCYICMNKNFSLEDFSKKIKELNSK